MQADLFQSETSSNVIQLPMQNANVWYQDNFILPRTADELFVELRQSIQWRQDNIKMYGKEVKIPRLHAWYGDSHATYSYSKLTLNPLPWTSSLLNLKRQCEQACNTNFNSVLANYYRDGQDSMGMHADNEVELGSLPTIASLTFGADRDFDFKHLHTGEKIRIKLRHGSLLVMSGETQKYWHHGISKRATAMGGRINLTFRYIHSLEN